MQWAIGVGSNKGERIKHIDHAAQMIIQDPDLRLCAQASLLDNPAQDAPMADAPYINTVWIIDSDLGPHQILHRLQRIENALGRVRTVYHGARTIDLDLLLSRENTIIDSPVLSIPHPAMHQRDFVMGPLSEIAGDWWHATEKQTIAQIAQRFGGGET